MNHWDLIPGEELTLVRVADGHRITARFLYRDTCRARFEVYAEPEAPPLRMIPKPASALTDFQLLDDGSLSRIEKVSETYSAARGYRIAGERADSSKGAKVP